MKATIDINGDELQFSLSLEVENDEDKKILKRLSEMTNSLKSKNIRNPVFKMCISSKTILENEHVEMALVAKIEEYVKMEL